MSLICDFICKFFGACRNRRDDTYESEPDDEDVAAVREEMLDVVSKNIYLTKSGKTVYEIKCDYTDGDGEWELRSDGIDDNVSEKEVIKMFNMVEVGKSYKVKYEVSLNDPDYEHIEGIISVDNISLRD